MTSKVSLLADFGFPVHEKRQAFPGRVAQPFLHRQAVSLGLGNLLAILVEKQLIGEAGGRGVTEDAADLPRQPDRIDQILARHLVIHAKRRPAHGPIHLPLELAAPPVTGVSDFVPVPVLINDGAGT